MLPPYYQVEEAVEKLNEVIEDCENPDNEQVDCPQFSTADLDEYQIIEYTEPQCWRLSMVNKITGEYAPVRMRFQGIISEFELPPIRKPGSLQSMERMRAHIRQAIMLTSSQSELFHRNMEQIELVQVKFSGALPPNSLKDWQPTYEGGNLVIDMHNRYFTKRTLAPNRPRAWMDRAVDPDSTLEAMQRDSKYIHLEENRVDYYKPGSKDGSGDLVTATPSSFRAGDIVETTVEFAAFPAGANQNVSVVVLKSIKMITDKYRNAAGVLFMRSQYKPKFWHTPGAYPQAKRKSIDVVDQDGNQEARDRAEKHRGLRKEELDNKEINHLGAPMQYATSLDFVVGQPSNKAPRNVSKELRDERLDIDIAEERLRGMQVSDPSVDP